MEELETPNNTFDTLGEAWLFGLKKVMLNGVVVEDKAVRLKDVSLDENIDLLERYKSATDEAKLHLKLKEVCGHFVVIKEISLDDEIVERFGDKTRIDYTKKRYSNDCGVGGYGEFIYGKNGENVRMVVDKLRVFKDSKSAVINAPNIWLGNEGKAPCLTAVVFLIRNGRLIMHTMYRSQNVYTKQLGNMIALRDLQKRVAQELGVELGEVFLYVCSAHIYESDWPRVNEIIEESVKEK